MTGEQQLTREQIHEQAEQFKVGSAKNTDASLHLMDGDDPLCEHTNQRWESSQLKTKDAEVYPYKYRDLCDYCVEKYRNLPKTDR